MSDPRAGRDRPADPAHPSIEEDVAGARSSQRSARRRLFVHAIFGAIGVTAVVLLVRAVGPRQLVAIVRASERWIPLLVAIELARIATDATATYLLSPRVRRAVPLGALGRMHLLGYAIATLMPAGRAAAEAVKAAMLSSAIGMPAAAAVGASNQALAMLGGAVVAIPCVAASFLLTGWSPLTAGVVVYAIVTGVMFIVVQIAYRRREVGGLLLRRFARAGQATVAFQQAILEIPVFPRAVVPVLAGRALQVLQMGILIHAVGASFGLGWALLAQGANLVGGSVGDLIPGQLGAVDGAFALAAKELGVSVANAVAASVILHAVQLALAATALLVTLVWRAPRMRAGADLASSPPAVRL